MSTDNQAIDWEAIPQFKADLEHLKNLRESENNETAFQHDSPMLFEKGHLLRLTLKVTDPYLAQVVLTRAFSNHSRVAGLEVMEVTTNPEGAERQHTAALLRQIADRLDQDPDFHLDPNRPL